MSITHISAPAAPAQPQPAIVPPKADGKAPARSEPAKPAAPAGDTVQVSSTAQKMLQEATETAAQTAMEAGKGDVQAKRLLAKEDAAKAATQGNSPAAHETVGENVDVKA